MLAPMLRHHNVHCISFRFSVCFVFNWFRDILYYQRCPLITTTVLLHLLVAKRSSQASLPFLNNTYFEIFVAVSVFSLNIFFSDNMLSKIDFICDVFINSTGKYPQPVFGLGVTL